MREIVIDTETTGLDAANDRIVEVGCVELYNHIPTGQRKQFYINPGGFTPYTPMLPGPQHTNVQEESTNGAYLMLNFGLDDVAFDGNVGVRVVRTENTAKGYLVFPNASFARGFEPVVVTTTKGESVTGVLKSEGEVIVLALVDGQERRIPRADVADMQPGAISLMPAGFADQLSRQELADLLAFLKGTRWGA